MSEGLSRPAGRRRRVVVITGFVVLVIVWVSVAGAALVRTGQPERADAIFALSGDPLGLRMQRAAELFEQTGSGRFVIFVDDRHPNRIERVDEKAVALGVPSSAVRVLGPVTSTSDEAGLAASMAERCGWTSVTIVTSPYHTRRAGWTFERALGDDVAATVASSAEDFATMTWWANPGDRKSVFSEWAKGLASLRYLVDPPAGLPTDAAC